MTEHAWLDARPSEGGGALDDFPVVVRLPVQWGQMDAYGHVNNVVLFRFFESARVAYLQRCTLAQSYETRGVGAILHSTDCRFRRPLFYPDTVLVGARTADLGEDRFTMEYRAWSLEEEDVAAEGTGLIVCFDYEAREKTPLPEDIRRRIREMEAAATG